MQPGMFQRLVIKVSIILLMGGLLPYSGVCQSPSSEEVATEQPTNLDSSDVKKYSFHKPVGYVSDFEGVFTASQAANLEKTLREFEQRTTHQMVVVTVNAIEPYSDFDQYATDLANEWGVGQKDKDNGLAIVLSKNLMRVRIATGLGTERTISDAFCQEVINQTMIPNFRDNEFYSGVKEGVDQLMAEWNLEYEKE